MASSTQVALEFSWPADWQENERVEWRKIAELAQEAKSQNKSVVFVTGVFDLFHQEHQNFLTKASAAGDILIVGIESDERVAETKGPNRPIQKQAQRLARIAEHPGVTTAAILPEAFKREEHYRAIIHLLRPQILAVSSHSPYLEKKQEIMRAFGGEVKIVHQHNPAVSTTQLIEVQ